MAQHWLIERGGRCFAAMLPVLTAVLAFSSLTAEAAKPRVAVVGFTSRVHKTDITLTALKEPLPYLLTAARDQLTSELAGEEKFDLYDFGAQATTQIPFELRQPFARGAGEARSRENEGDGDEGAARPGPFAAPLNSAARRRSSPPSARSTRGRRTCPRRREASLSPSLR